LISPSRRDFSLVSLGRGQIDAARSLALKRDGRRFKIGRNLREFGPNRVLPCIVTILRQPAEENRPVAEADDFWHMPQSAQLH
jgi:hypothetical protein